MGPLRAVGGASRVAAAAGTASSLAPPRWCCLLLRIRAGLPGPGADLWEPRRSSQGRRVRDGAESQRGRGYLEGYEVGFELRGERSGRRVITPKLKPRAPLIAQKVVVRGS